MICPGGRDVIENGQTFSTGIWVISEIIAREAVSNMAIVALYENHNTKSYLQGIVVGYERAQRYGNVRINIGTILKAKKIDEKQIWNGNMYAEKAYERY